MEISKKKIAYWLTGMALIIWINVAMHVYGSEATFVPFILLTIIAIPVSFAVNAIDHLLWSINPGYSLSTSIIKQNLFVLLILFAGHFQWFYFIPWVTRKFTGR